MITSYATTFYGSSLWSLQSKECEKLYRTWNVTIRTAYNLDKKTHRFLIEPISGLHLKTILLARYVTFYQGLVSSPKFVVRFLARLVERDLRTLMGSTLDYLLKDCNLNDDFGMLRKQLVKKNCHYVSPPVDCEWVALLTHELISLRDCDLRVDGFSKQEIDEMLYHVCTS